MAFFRITSSRQIRVVKDPCRHLAVLFFSVRSVGCMVGKSETFSQKDGTGWSISQILLFPSIIATYLYILLLVTEPRWRFWNIDKAPLMIGRLAWSLSNPWIYRKVIDAEYIKGVFVGQCQCSISMHLIVMIPVINNPVIESSSRISGWNRDLHFSLGSWFSVLFSKHQRTSKQRTLSRCENCNNLQL